MHAAGRKGFEDYRARMVQQSGFDMNFGHAVRARQTQRFCHFYNTLLVELVIRNEELVIAVILYICEGGRWNTDLRLSYIIMRIRFLCQLPLQQRAVRSWCGGTNHRSATVHRRTERVQDRCEPRSSDRLRRLQQQPLPAARPSSKCRLHGTDQRRPADGSCA